MQGLGPVEFTVIAVVAVMLFGPTLLAFWLGFVLGKKRGTPSGGSQSANVEPAPPTPQAHPDQPSAEQPTEPGSQPTEESTTHD